MKTFHDMELRYGTMAYQCLTEIEKAAAIPAHTTKGVDPEIRLANAFRAQDAMRIALASRIAA